MVVEVPEVARPLKFSQTGLPKVVSTMAFGLVTIMAPVT
jgi:hypothetical protein